jgi:Sir2 family
MVNYMTHFCSTTEYTHPHFERYLRTTWCKLDDNNNNETARVPDELLMECHGNFRSASCIRCQTQALDIAAVQRTIVQDQQVPRCHKCHDGYVKPDIVFFGEGLPDRFHTLLQQDLPVADCCLILGTSLQVAPVSHIPTRVVHRSMFSPHTRSAAAPPVVCKRVLLNREWVGDDCLPGFGMNPSDDVFHLGDCDDSIQILARLLGWHDELQQRYNAIHSP